MTALRKPALPCIKDDLRSLRKNSVKIFCQKEEESSEAFQTCVSNHSPLLSVKVIDGLSPTKSATLHATSRHTSLNFWGQKLPWKFLKVPVTSHCIPSGIRGLSVSITLDIIIGSD